MKSFLLFSVLFALTVSANALDREAFSITRYELQVRVEPQQQRLAVRGKIALRNDSETPQKNAALQISSSLNWLSIQLDGKPVEFFSQPYTSDIDHTGALTEAILTLSPIAPGKTIELDVGYEGTIPWDATRLARIGVPAETAKHSDWDRIERNFSAVRGIGYVTWYPVATEAASLSESNSVVATAGRWKQREVEAAMKVQLCAADNPGEEASSPPTFIFMNDGEARAGGMNAGGATDAKSPLQCREHNFPQLGRTVPTFVIGKYSTNVRENAIIHYLPEHKSGADDYALALDQATPIVSQWFADTKSERKPELLDLPEADDAPFESGNALLMPLGENDTELLLAAVRQLAHAAVQSPRLWISEGLAGYAQVAYLQNEKGRPASIAYLQGHRAALVASERDNSAQDKGSSAAHSLINDPDEFYVATKAMSVWWMLRDMVGETALTQALRKYKALDDKDAYYMQKLIESESHKDLAWFFDNWVYRDRGLPEFRIESVYARELLEGGYMVTVTVENTGDAAAEVPVTLRMPEGVATDRLLVSGKSKASIRIRAPRYPEEAIVNDGSVPEMKSSDNRYKMPAVTGRD